jgi:thymidylate kinase
MQIRIALTGPMGSGKTTIANAIKERYGSQAIILPMAQPLKDFAKQMGWDGRKDKRGRRLLQLLGTECGRKCISEDVWVDKWDEEANKWSGSIVICDDCRFDNETAVMNMVFELPMRFDECTTWWQKIKKIWRYKRGLVHKSERGITMPTIKVPLGTVDDMATWIISRV